MAQSRKRLFSFVVGLTWIALASLASAQQSDDNLLVTWQPRAYGILPALEGEVQNNGSFWVSGVRLRVEGFDASGEPVGERSTWTFGNIAPGGGRGHFVVPPLPRATTYRITVSEFDRVSGGGSPGARSFQAP
jgi:hypothetical protein